MTLEMESSNDPENQMMIEGNIAQNMKIDPERARFPCCIVWTPLPVISWLVPFIGHIGIGREDGVILDFAGPNFVCVDNFTFGAVARYLQINSDKVPKSMHDTVIGTSFPTFLADFVAIDMQCCCIVTHRSEEDEFREGEISTWDDALRRSTQEFQHRSYNLLTCNCHSFVANNLNRLGFRTGGWNVVNLAALIFLKGRWVSKGAVIRTLLPFVVVFSIGLALGGTTFLTFLAFFNVFLVGWFILGTYVFKNLVQL
ncbi:protein RTE1-HOMOLOG-like isoform X1 [Cucurbita pepo subsp. pepo]|uniref:protein RTE1-HOMOLOG-like isoform X1 n=1 Tax=Cucurbita pepo subsp. pepo TaxID=3664 RepID=UPI000C9D4491|nr:protein RTE1-HOMOLOG-like isoform X1 [Cucurbita pepo subsp. pepo]XP_023552336.1 protein RTE1-HOMOLOG-like isoform X1 [Cucurbita pepo subsp. pepo]